MMLSSRGAITTNVAMVECAAGQNSNSKQVFLLSELEKVWVSICILARRHLLEGKNVQIPNFGSFWLEERCLISDSAGYRQRFHARRLFFGINAGFSLRYGMDGVKAPLERPGLPYVKLHMAEVVAVCAVPAHTAAMALREFIMYIGEGLYCGRTFTLSFPGVAGLVVKKERFMLTADAELQAELFEADSRRWPPEVQEEGRRRLDAEQHPAATPSRPGSQASRPSRPPTAASSSAATAASGRPRAVFSAAAPKDRLFAEIEKEAERRRAGERERALAERGAAQRQDRLDRMIDDYDYYAVDDGGGLMDMAPPCPQHGGGGVTVTYRPTTGESVYGWAVDSAANSPNRRPAPEPEQDEPDVEVIEVTSEASAERPRPAVAAAAAGAKDAQLAAVLRQEEVFSRPLSRRACVEHTSVRDLIYGGPGEAPASRPPTADRPRRCDPVADGLTVAPQHNQPPADAAVAPHFGRKRHTEYYSTDDRADVLLKGLDGE